MSQDFQKLQEYKQLNETLPRVWVVFGEEEDEVELYQTRELAEEALESIGSYATAFAVPIRSARFWELHKEIHLSEQAEEDECCDGCDCDDDEEEDEPYVPVPVAPKPTKADIENKLRGLGKLKEAVAQKRSVVTAPAPMVQPTAQTQNNDGRLTCYACGEPTKIVDTGFGKPYCICTVCGK